MGDTLLEPDYKRLHPTPAHLNVTNGKAERLAYSMNTADFDATANVNLTKLGLPFV